MRSSIVCVSSSITSSASMTCSAALRSPSSSACVPPAIASVVSAARRITSMRSSSRLSWNALRASSGAAFGDGGGGHNASNCAEGGCGAALGALPVAADLAVRCAGASCLHPRTGPTLHCSFTFPPRSGNGFETARPYCHGQPGTARGSPLRELFRDVALLGWECVAGESSNGECGAGNSPLPGPTLSGRSPAQGRCGRAGHFRTRRPRVRSPVTTKCTCSAMVTAWSPMRS